MKTRVESIKSGKYLKDIEGKLYPEMKSVVIKRVTNPHVAKDLLKPRKR